MKSIKYTCNLCNRIAEYGVTWVSSSFSDHNRELSYIDVKKPAESYNAHLCQSCVDALKNMRVRDEYTYVYGEKK